ncbi:hypothetical protein [Nitrosopumilus sp. S4]
MKKTILIGATIIIIIGILIVSGIISNDIENSDEIVSDQSLSLEDTKTEVLEEKGRNLSVELSESIGLKSP